MRELLEATLKELVQGEGKAVVLPQFNGVYITDCIRLVWGEAGMKLGVRWEIQRGHLHGCLMLTLYGSAVKDLPSSLASSLPIGRCWSPIGSMTASVPLTRSAS
ncbi:MAG: hypothetical protein L6Q98_22505 [Anaerolineae bacterium]|nr:hypothetical protein [Anaerolineae bacterium]NUQ06236.1 hypothetical protein [Anaerolineae bacterium]